MKAEIEIGEAIGKVLKNYSFSITEPQAVLTFEDGTFTTLEIDHPGSVYASIEPGKLKLMDFGHDRLIGIGVITQEELDSIQATCSARLQKESEQREKVTYRLLHKKYGPETVAQEKSK